jgi:VWFA-related protein
MRAFLTLYLTITAMAATATAGQEPQRPVIRSGVELLVVDVQVVDRQGQPILTLGAVDFEVTIDRKPRRVTSAQLVRHTTVSIANPVASGAAAPAPPASAAPATIADGRRFILAIDEHSFRPASARAAMQAATRFIDQLQPSDLVGLYVYPTGAVHSDLTNDHAAVRRMLGKITGLLDVAVMRYNISTSEAIDIASGDRDALARVLQRECRNSDQHCRRQIPLDATSLAVYFEMSVSQSLAGLRRLVSGLKKLEGRKTLVIVSGGLFTSDSAIGRGQMAGDIRSVGLEAAASNTNLYVLHMDSSFLDAFSERRGPGQTQFRDSGQMAAGLEVIADAGGGALIRVQAGSGDGAFQRVLRENSVYYLLGVEPEASDRDGAAHAVQVRVRGRGLTVRSRKQVVVPK